jgi:hypothetical protein
MQSSSAGQALSSQHNLFLFLPARHATSFRFLSVLGAWTQNETIPIAPSNVNRLLFAFIQPSSTLLPPLATTKPIATSNNLETITKVINKTKSMV